MIAQATATLWLSLWRPNTSFGQGSCLQWKPLLCPTQDVSARVGLILLDFARLDRSWQVGTLTTSWISKAGIICSKQLRLDFFPTANLQERPHDSAWISSRGHARNLGRLLPSSEQGEQAKLGLGEWVV